MKVEHDIHSFRTLCLSCLGHAKCRIVAGLIPTPNLTTVTTVEIMGRKIDGNTVVDVAVIIIFVAIAFLVYVLIDIFRQNRFRKEYRQHLHYLSQSYADTQEIEIFDRDKVEVEILE